MVDCYVENITEVLHVIEKFHGARNCQLATCQVKLFPDNPKLYLVTEGKSSRLLRKYFFELSDAYPVGFRDCFSITKKITF